MGKVAIFLLFLNIEKEGSQKNPSKNPPEHPPENPPENPLQNPDDKG